MRATKEALHADQCERDIMLGVPGKDEGVLLTEHRAMVEMPEDSVEVTLSAKVYHDGELINVSKVLSMGDIREAFRKADVGYIDEDDRFVLTEKGLQWLDENKC